MKYWTTLSLIITSLCAISQVDEKGLLIGYEQFDAGHPKSNINNNWRWFSISYFTPISKKYSLSVGLNTNASYLFAKGATQMFNPLPRGKNFTEKVGLLLNHQYLLKSFNNDVHWFLSSKWSWNPTRIYGTQVEFDTTTNSQYFINRFSERTNLLRFDLGFTLRARINDPFSIEFRPSYQYIYLKTNDFGSFSGFRFTGSVNLFYRFK